MKASRLFLARKGLSYLFPTQSREWHCHVPQILPIPRKYPRWGSWKSTFWCRSDDSHRRFSRPDFSYQQGQSPHPVRLDQSNLLIHRKPTPEDISDAVHLNHRHRSDKSPMKIGHSSLTDNRNRPVQDRKSTRLNSSHVKISYAVFCLK